MIPGVGGSTTALCCPRSIILILKELEIQGIVFHFVDLLEKLYIFLQLEGERVLKRGVIFLKKHRVD